MVGKVLDEFLKFCDKEYRENHEDCNNCKYFKEIEDRQQIDCFKEYLKDKCIE